MREWILTLTNELPLWELESWWTPKFSKNNCKGQNPLDWNLFYIIGKLLEFKCFKLGLHDPFRRLKYKLWPLKVENCPNFLPCMKHAIYCWKALKKNYNFALNLISIEGLHAKLWACKFTRVPTLGILRLPLGSPGTKWHLGASFVAKHRVYYKGEGGGFPQVWALVSLVSPWLFVVRSCTKVLQLSTNQLVWFVQVCVSK